LFWGIRLEVFFWAFRAIILIDMQKEGTIPVLIQVLAVGDGMPEFVRQTSAYRSTTADLVALDDIEPPFRLPSRPFDWRGFERTRMVFILQGFVAGEAIPPIDLLVLPTLNDISGQPFKYLVLAGVHRFYASMAVGFEFLPSTMRGVCS